MCSCDMATPISTNIVFLRLKIERLERYLAAEQQPSVALIRRHKKILAAANPFDPQFKIYFEKRDKERKTSGNATENSKYAGLKI